MNKPSIASLSTAKNVLVIGAGGGNDSFSCFLLLSHLAEIAGFDPDHMDVLAMLPSCLTYQNTVATENPLVCQITPQSTRWAGNKELTAFPEKILSSVKDDLPFKQIGTIFGAHMTKGSVGILDSLQWLVNKNNYDLILAVDVGGDFITQDGNIGVLSPQMDGYVGWALQQLSQQYPVLFGIFGLATDGESTRPWIDLCLKAAKASTLLHDKMKPNDKMTRVIDLYKSAVEPNRYSRTTDYSIREILGEGHDNPSLFRCRMHVQDSPTTTKKFYATYMHAQDPQYWGDFLILDSIAFVKNRYCIKANNAFSWVQQVHSKPERINHELCGQYEQSVYYCLPSFRFSSQDRREMAQLTVTAVKQGWYDHAVGYLEDFKEVVYDDSIEISSLGPNLVSIIRCPKNSFF